MSTADLTAQQTADLAALADAIIPPDAIDAGAAAVHAGPRLAERIRAGVNAAVYLKGLEMAQTLAQSKFGRDVTSLGADERHELIAGLRDAPPGFFKQLRLDVSALYLSDVAVWQRIGFPGPSAPSGGHPDFDQPQSPVVA
jgi:hypothetical protein